MGYLATVEIFENMLQLKRFGIMNRKWLLSYRNDAISYRNARGFGGMLPEKILKRLMQSGAFLIFDRLSLKSTTICYKKISIIHYNWLHSRAENWWHISTQKPPNVGSSTAHTGPAILGWIG